jgi:hypothetical protein
MSTPTDTADFSRFTNDMYQLWEQSMTSWWDQVLDSPEFLGASGKGLSAMAQSRKDYEKKVDETLVQMHVPTRGDMTRLARIATLLEERILKMEDTVLETRDLIEARDTTIVQLERGVVEARIEAVEARLELRETLASMQAQLNAIQERTVAAPAAKTKPATAKAKPARRTRKTTRATDPTP